eukprot:6108009-Alexandrium_andersonii.AAC.1
MCPWGGARRGAFEGTRKALPKPSGTTPRKAPSEERKGEQAGLTSMPHAGTASLRSMRQESTPQCL